MNKMFSFFRGESAHQQQICKYDISEEQFIASFILSAVGDALGYKNGSWEFSKIGTYILKEAELLGGVMNLKLELPEWSLSDDTIMHIATAKALISDWFSKKEFHVDLEKTLYPKICEEYVICWADMTGRAPGIQCAQAMPLLKAGKWNHLNFSGSGGGCGAAMRAMCIGLMLYKADPVKDPTSLELLVEIGIESGRMTHNHPTGFLGSVAAAVLTAYAVQKVPIHLWGYKLVHEVLPVCYEYLKQSKRNWTEYNQGTHLKYFEDQWKEYLKLRKIHTGKVEDEAVFPEKYGPEERDAFYKSVSYSGWGGSSGHDSVIIAYDALLGCKAPNQAPPMAAVESLSPPCKAPLRQNSSQLPLQNLEYRKELEELAKKLYATTVQFYEAKEQGKSAESSNANTTNQNTQNAEHK